MNSHSDKETIIDNFDWNQLSLERLKLLKAKISKAMDLKRHELYLTKSTTNNTLIYGYRVSLSKVSPARLRSSLSEYQKCIFGISLGSKNFVERKRIEPCIKWISENFNACLVLVTDSIYRLTIEVRQGVKGDEARLEAIRTGEQFINENYSLFEQYSGSCQFQLKKASEIEQQSDFKRYYEELQSLYQKNESFQGLVNLFAQNYLNRIQQLEIQQVDEGRQHLGITYLLEESALNACLVKQGWLVVVYPGSIKTFEDISEGLHPEVPLPLQQMIWVSLRLKKWTAGSGSELK
ncbi:MAG: tRNA-dependent cyclodipeptide synthase [Moorea sp. SIO1F2]|uniref:tRNA-dependent cyclodipeptide synthase n=1 Tax=Moorena sp. SIO1F2 TaxID=2607819 RepID=UPI0013BDE60B|nr:tRNA-dependent cyclodipeptide synthase [Moorena sp. SIO1F2]NEO63566.1 tRNA-dependent cyclodipeptide synthase [Moorena sp. SIO4G2]NET81245.1 tRNA-dependent cyclodipeptide synthase [Moorena sp. SIO1F2]